MRRFGECTKTTLIGGLLVVLPLYLTTLLLAKVVGGFLVEIQDGLVPAFIVEKMPNGSSTDFVPSLPTSCVIYILPRARVHPVDVLFATAVSVFSRWGTGAGPLSMRWRNSGVRASQLLSAYFRIERRMPCQERRATS